MRKRELIWGGLVGLGALGIAGTLIVKDRLKPPPLGFEPDPDFVIKAQQLINANPMIDTHAHPGRTFVKDADNTSLPLWLRLLAKNTFEDKSIADMQKSGITAVAFAGVADINVIGMQKGGLLTAAREFKTDEAWQSYRIQINNLKAAVNSNGIGLALSPDDIRRGALQHTLKAILTMEGADFLNGKLERLQDVYNDGVRSVTIVHYRASEIGDIQTQAPVRNGLTAFGIEAVKEMQRLGMIIDLAHASEATAFTALKQINVPVMMSHTHLNGGPAGNYPRFISDELAQAVKLGGGIIGAWPTGMGISTMNGFIERIFELHNRIGSDSICIGTDLDANYKPVVTKYIDLILVVSELLKRKMSEVDVIKFIGGNFMRVFEQVNSAKFAIDKTGTTTVIAGNTKP